MSPQTKMNDEVTLQEIFADPIVQLLMARDGVTARDCEAVLTGSIEQSPGKDGARREGNSRFSAFRRTQGPTH